MSYTTPVHSAPQMTGTTPNEVPAPVYTDPYQSMEKSALGGNPAQQPAMGTYNGVVPLQQDPNYHQLQNIQQNPNVQQQIPQQHQNGQQPGAVPQTSKFLSATPLASLQGTPAPVDCPLCGVREMTRTEFVTGGTTHLAALLCCWCLCLGCIPYMASWFKDCQHHCGSCGGVLATWHRSGRTEVIAHGRV